MPKIYKTILNDHLDLISVLELLPDLRFCGITHTHTQQQQTSTSQHISCYPPTFPSYKTPLSHALIPHTSYQPNSSTIAKTITSNFTADSLDIPESQPNHSILLSPLPSLSLHTQQLYFNTTHNYLMK